MAANYTRKIGNSYCFGTFEADTPIAAEFDKPVKELRVPLALDLLAGSTPAAYSFIPEGGTIRFPNIGGYPVKFLFGGTAANDCLAEVIEYGDAANTDYFKVIEPEGSRTAAAPAKKTKKAK
jgi:hypothetical protein